MAEFTADAVVIGGGINGTSTAFQLASMGMTNIILVERRQLAAGATGKSGALVRMHYTNAYESQLAHESFKIFQQFEELTGGSAGWTGTGFVQLVAPGFEDALRRNVERQQELGIDTQMLSREDLRELDPRMYVDDVGAAAYEPLSGHADPNAAAYSFAQAAERLGVRIWTHCEATEILRDDAGVSGVKTERGEIATRNVVLAPGAFANRLLDQLGLNFGLFPHRSVVTIFQWPPGFTQPHIVVIDNIHLTWMRTEGTHSSLIGVEQPRASYDPDNLQEGITTENANQGRDHLAKRFPAFADATMRGGWAGMYMMSPDSRPIIDQLPEIPGLFVMLGDSGTSFKTAPAIGKCLAEWVTQGEPQTVDLTPFRASRFAEGKPWKDDDAYSPKRLSISR